jgi:hypothetical protein
MGNAGHGPNIGHGYVKYVVIDSQGNELPPVVFPAMVGRAARSVTGAIGRAATVSAAGSTWWTGEDALLAPSPLTILAQERLNDPAFIPVLIRGALQRLGPLNGATNGMCVTGLPATWAGDGTKARALGAHLRDAAGGYSGIRVIPEPLGLVYAETLDNHGQVTGDPALLEGQVAVIDLGHHTVDIAVLQRMIPVPSSLATYQLGTARPLRQITGQLSNVFERELSLFETDQAVRAQALLVAGQPRKLPTHWDRPLVQNGEAIAARLVEAWGSGAQFEAILIGGGGAELATLVEAIQQRFRPRPSGRPAADRDCAGVCSTGTSVGRRSGVIEGLTAQAALAQEPVEPGALLGRQVGWWRVPAVVDPQIVAGIDIDRVQGSTEVKRDVGVWSAQRHREERNGVTQRQGPDRDLGPLLNPAEKDEVGVRRQRGRQAGASSATEQVDLQQVGVAAEDLAPLAVVGISTVGTRTLVDRREDLDRGDQRFVAKGADLDPAVAGRQIERGQTGQRCRRNRDTRGGRWCLVALYDTDVGDHRSRCRHINGLERRIGHDHRRIARADLALQLAPQGQRQRGVDIGPQAGCFEIGIHTGKGRFH